MSKFNNLGEAINLSRIALKTQGQVVNVSRWQGQNVGGTAKARMIELLHYRLESRIPGNDTILADLVKPNKEWADEHFAERISGEPTNPGESYKRWPWYPKDDSAIKQEIFTHTYQERFWPKLANKDSDPWNGGQHLYKEQMGIRFPYGDLNDVITMIFNDPFTRQAYLPIWFPEDTGAVHGGRVPCTLGYHFIHRQDFMDIEYHIRSCDILRHFQDDIYLACKLLYYVLDQLREGNKLWWDGVQPGNLIMNIGSLHCFEKERNTL